MRWCAVES